jgi:hypothetical protein
MTTSLPETPCVAPLKLGVDPDFSKDYRRVKENGVRFFDAVLSAAQLSGTFHYGNLRHWKHALPPRELGENL